MTGYSIKYAYRAPLPDGGERIILATDRRLGAHVAGVAAGVERRRRRTTSSRVIEMRFDAKGVGEGKTSLTTQVVVDDAGEDGRARDYAAARRCCRR